MKYGFVKRGVSKRGGWLKRPVKYFTNIKHYFLISKNQLFFLIFITLQFFKSLLNWQYPENKPI